MFVYLYTSLPLSLHIYIYLHYTYICLFVFWYCMIIAHSQCLHFPVFQSRVVWSWSKWGARLQSNEWKIRCTASAFVSRKFDGFKSIKCLAVVNRFHVIKTCHQRKKTHTLWGSSNVMRKHFKDSKIQYDSQTVSNWSERWIWALRTICFCIRWWSSVGPLKGRWLFSSRCSLLGDATMKYFWRWIMHWMTMCRYPLDFVPYRWWTESC